MDQAGVHEEFFDDVWTHGGLLQTLKYKVNRIAKMPVNIIIKYVGSSKRKKPRCLEK